MSSTLPDTCNILNINAEESIAPHITFENKDPNECIISECDPELLILIEFKKVIKLQNIVFYASKSDDQSEMSPPKLVHIYKPKNLNINFNDITSLKPTVSLKCSAKKLHKGHAFNINNKGKFNKVKRLAIFIETNQNDTEATYVNGIWLNYDHSTYRFDTKDTEKMQTFCEFVASLSNNNNAAISNDKYRTVWLNSDHPRPYGGTCDLTQCISFKRISNILCNYNVFISNQRDDDEKKQTANAMDSIYPNNYTNTDLLNDEYHLLLVHSEEFEKIYELLIDTTNNNQKACDLSQCLMMKRNQRNRSIYVNNTNLLSKLYSTDKQQDIVQQQFIDRIHCHYFHSFDIGYRMTREEKQIVLEEEAKTEDADSNVDVCVVRFHKLIETKQKSYRNMEGLERLNASSNKYIGGIQRDKEKEKSAQYSYGVRYFYWKHYQQNKQVHDPSHNNTEEKWIDGLFIYHNQAQKQMLPPANHGKCLGDWYVSKKYDSLKEELLNNEICVIGKDQFSAYMSRAAYYKQADHVKKLNCSRSEAEQFYEVKYKSLIGDNHLVSMMVYCNCDILQNKFTETFRRQSEDETDESMKQRHRNFYFLGRLLRETVECFGIKQPGNENIHLWHGIDQQFSFSSMFAFIKGPLSTTTAYAVAVSFCQNKGMLLQLNMNSFEWDCDYQEIPTDTPQVTVGGQDNRICCFDCSWISDYSNENEIFCLGGLYKFTFNAIIEAPAGTNYFQYIKALKQMTYNMSVGDLPTEEDVPKTVQEQQMVFRLLSYELYRVDPKHKYAHPFKSCPVYMKHILHQHAQNIKTIFFSNTKETQCKIQDMLFKYDNNWIKIDLLLKIFPNTQHICYNAMAASKVFLQSPAIYGSVLTFLKENGSNQLQYIEVLIEPSDFMDISNYIAKYKGDFAKYSWRIEAVFIEDVNREVSSIQRREVFGLDDDSASIATMTQKGTKRIPDTMKTSRSKTVRPDAKPRTAILMAPK